MIHITIGWLYPDLMNTYGDRGNMMILKKRLTQRRITVDVKEITLNDPATLIAECDILLMGGAQDHQQEIVYKDLLAKKEALVTAIENGVPGIFVCGAYQLLGNYYITASGERIQGLGILDIYTESAKPGEARLIGDSIVQLNIADIEDNTVVGFENHGGRTYLSGVMAPLGRVTHGFGNNGCDKSEGVLYKNTIGTYLHGPVLSKNPQLADWVISQAITKKTGQSEKLTSLDDRYEQLARESVLKKYRAKG